MRALVLGAALVLVAQSRAQPVPDSSVAATVDSILAAAGMEGYGGFGTTSASTWGDAARIPDLTGRIVDLADLVSPSLESMLTERLAAHEDSTGNQIAVLTIPSLRGEVLEPYATEVFRTWGLGDAEANNGVLLLVARDDRKIRIEVGYGLEGAIPDVLAARIIRNEMTPRFRDGDFGGGIAAALDALMGAATGTYSPPPEIARLIPSFPPGATVFGLFLVLPLWIWHLQFGSPTLKERLGIALFGLMLSMLVALVAAVLVEEIVLLLPFLVAPLYVVVDSVLEVLVGSHRAIRRRALSIASTRSARVSREKSALFRAARKAGEKTVTYDGKVISVPPLRRSSSSGGSSSWSSSSSSSSFSGGGGSSGGGGASGGW